MKEELSWEFLMNIYNIILVGNFSSYLGRILKEERRLYFPLQN